MWIIGTYVVWLKTCLATWQWLLTRKGNHHWFRFQMSVLMILVWRNLSFFVFSPGRSWEFEWWVPSTQFIHVSCLYLFCISNENVLRKASQIKSPKLSVYSPSFGIRIQIVSGSRTAKITHKNRKMLINLIFWSAVCSLLRAEGFSCSLDVLFMEA